MKFKEYLDGRIKIFNIDCFEFLKNFNEQIDLVLIDPPYLYTEYDKGNKGFNETNEVIDAIKKISTGFDFENFFELIKQKQKFVNLFSFCSVKQIPEILKKGFDKKLQTNLLTWKKHGRPFGKTWLHDTEYICHIRQSGSIFNGAYKSRLFEYASERITGHPTEKPQALIDKLVLYGSDENSLVFDGFIGSGTTALSCLKLDRRFVGCETEPRFFEIACERIEKELKQLNLFDNKDYRQTEIMV